MDKLKKVKNNTELLSAVLNSYHQHFLKLHQPIQIDIALSGGMDSMVLMVVLYQLRSDIQMSLRAIHVHHGLSQNADHWLSFCQKQCDILGVDLSYEKVDIQSDRGMGVEAAARKQRYQVFEKYRYGILVLAHHQNDQAETLMLQLFRGSGLKGLAAMQNYDSDRKIWRPFLGLKRQLIEEFARQNKVNFIDDESNDDLYYDRNFLRQKVLPLIESRYPNIIQTISRSADNIADGLSINESIAKEDAEQYFFNDKSQLSLSMLKKLPKERVINLIRWWLNHNQQLMPSKKTMEELFDQILHVKKDAMLNISIAPLMTIRAYQGQLYLVEKKNKLMPYELMWHGEDEITLPDQTKLLFKKTIGDGLSLSKLGVTTLRIQNRIGGERFKPNENRPSRTLKYLLRTSKIPPWERDSIPLIFSEDRLVAVPRFGVHHEFQSTQDELGYQLEWINHQ